MTLRILSAAFLLAAFSAPLLLSRRWPMGAVLAYWVLLAFIPSQALSFTHPVADRYLFFPSAAVVILIAWGVVAAGERQGKPGMVGAAAILLVVALLWGRATLAYLAEWRDPRSVWYAASGRTSDPDVYYNLGWAYMSMADRLGPEPRGRSLPGAEARRLAAVVWAGDRRLPALLAEWSAGRSGGPVEKAFQNQLRTLAWNAFESALRAKGNRVMPDLYYHRGVILVDRGDMEGARKEFLATVRETSRDSFVEGREVTLVNSYNALAVIAEHTHKYREALGWFRLAEERQARFGGAWVPNLAAKRQRLEAIVAGHRAD
jgi:hypothetical protein